MKVTKRQLRRIIKEEKAKLVNEMSDEEEMDRRYMEAMQDLYESLELALAAAKKAGIDYPDLMTAYDDAKESVGY